jgi:uncharacterized protein YjbI with pentapeptide repeats
MGKLEGVCFMGVHLTGVHLIGACLMGVYVTGMRLMGVYLTGVRLLGVYLINVHLTGVHLIGVYLIDMCLTGVHSVLPDPPSYKRRSIRRDLSCKIRIFVLVAEWSLLRAAHTQSEVTQAARRPSVVVNEKVALAGEEIGTCRSWTRQF